MFVIAKQCIEVGRVDANDAVVFPAVLTVYVGHIARDTNSSSKETHIPQALALVGLFTCR